MAINSIMIVGRITREPEYRQTATGYGILVFGIAVNERRKNQQGDWEDYANFFDCKVMGKRAEPLSMKLHKGMKVAIEGRLHYSSWERDGQKKSKVEIIANEVEFMAPSQHEQQEQPQQAETAYYVDDLPF